MNILVISDVHIEFHADGGDSFIASLRDDVDAVVIAGDLCSYQQLQTVLGKLCQKFSRVMYALGNHESYGHSIMETKSLVHAIARDNPNLHVLDNAIVEIDGIRFIGTTMWFSHDPYSWNCESSMNDFRMIHNFREEVYDENRRALSFLHANVREGDVVITHHLPTYACVSKAYAGSDMNRYFVCGMDSLIFDARPSLWIHGHTHDSKDFLHGSTRIVCNPFGYLMSPNASYHDKIIRLPLDMPVEATGMYPSDWPECPNCGTPALDGHITCGDVRCNEGGMRDGYRDDA